MEPTVPQKNKAVELCRNIRSRRAWLGLTQAEVGLKVGVPARTVSFWESGARQPNADQVKRIADALEVPVGFLYDEVAA